uniref:Uncharacterized protein n=1 Tax=Oreochromis niloticus TaxID=8128 RepID=A0A669BBM5_ORENI
MSSTITDTLSVPDFGGFPPSTAVTVNVLCAFSFSRSRDFCKTKNGTLSSPISLICKLK